MIIKRNLRKRGMTNTNVFFDTNIILDFLHDYTAEERKDMLLGVCEIMGIVGIDKAKIITALTDGNFADIEDCLQSECAKAANAGYIVTRNPNDFTSSSIPVLLPEDFLKLRKGIF